METIFSDFIKHETVDEVVILKYKDKLPKELIETWRKYGFGSFVNTGLKFPKNAGLKFLTSLILILKAEGTPQPSFSPPCDMNRL